MDIELFARVPRGDTAGGAGGLGGLLQALLEARRRPDARPTAVAP